MIFFSLLINLDNGASKIYKPYAIVHKERIQNEKSNKNSANS